MNEYPGLVIRAHCTERPEVQTGCNTQSLAGWEQVYTIRRGLDDKNLEQGHTIILAQMERHPLQVLLHTCREALAIYPPYCL